MESRKRHLTEETDRSSHKKRAMLSASGSPTPVNGATDVNSVKEPREEDELEQFRKGAIFRRMRHYCRERDRCQRRVSELEKSKHAQDAEMAVVDACWTQLVDSIRRLVNVDQHVPSGKSSNDVELDIPEDVRANASRDVLMALRRRMQLTKDIVATFVKVAGSGAHLGNHSPAQCQRSMSECVTLQSELKATQARLRDVQQERDRYYNELAAAETRLDRARSKTLNVLHKSESEPQTKSESADTQTDVKTEGEREEHKRVSPPARSQSPAVNGTQDLQHELEIERGKVEHRDKEIALLEKENALLRDHVILNQSQIAALTEDIITNTPCYKLLAEQAAQHAHDEKAAREELSRVQNEFSQLQENRRQWQEEFTATTSKEAANLKLMVSKRDEDIVRLRQQRDQLDSQVKELKALASGKWSSLDSFKSLAESRGERITVLASEVTRLRSRLAAAAGDDDLLQFLSKDSELTMNYANDLKQRLAQAEAHCTALKKTLQERDPSQAALSAELANVRAQLDSTEQRLASYEADAADSRSMESQLKDSLEQIKTLKLKEVVAEQDTAALCSEVDKLSAAWEALDKQLQNQAMTVEKWEEERDKLNVAKARSDNKYYKCMNDQEAKENERKNVLRTLERQTKLMENLSKSEKGLSTTIETLEKDISQYRKLNAAQSDEIKSLETQVNQLRMKSEEHHRKLQEYIERYNDREVALADRTQEKLKCKDEITQLKKELQKATERARPVVTGTSSEREAQLQAEVTKCMRLLKCSTCQNAMRSTVITKCMHSFCKECIDARISHRQRKCPACGLAFAQSDVQPLYLQ